MSLKRDIVEISTHDHVYAVSDPLIEDVEIESIEMKRDGLVGVNKGMSDESNYLLIGIVKNDDGSEEQKIVDLIPSREVKRVRFVESKEAKKEEEIEVQQA